MALSIKQIRRRALKKAQAQGKANLQLATATVSTRTSEPAACDNNEQSSDYEESSEESDESNNNSDDSYED